MTLEVGLLVIIAVLGVSIAALALLLVRANRLRTEAEQMVKVARSDRLLARDQARMAADVERRAARALADEQRRHAATQRLLDRAWEVLEPIQEPVNELMNFRDRMDARMAEIDVEWAEVMGRGADAERTLAAAGD